MNSQHEFQFVSEENVEGDEVAQFRDVIHKFGNRGVAAAISELVELRKLGADFEVAASLEIACAVEEDLVSKKRFMRYVSSAARIEAELKEFDDEIVVAALEVQGKDASVLRNLVERKLKENGTVREAAHFSHPGKRKFASRPNRKKAGGAL